MRNDWSDENVLQRDKNMSCKTLDVLHSTPLHIFKWFILCMSNSPEQKKILTLQKRTPSRKRKHNLSRRKYLQNII